MAPLSFIKRVWKRERDEINRGTKHMTSAKKTKEASDHAKVVRAERTVASGLLLVGLSAVAIAGVGSAANALWRWHKRRTTGTEPSIMTDKTTGTTATTTNTATSNNTKPNNAHLAPAKSGKFAAALMRDAKEPAGSPTTA